MSTPPRTATQIRVVYPHVEQPIYENSTFLMGSVHGAPAGAVLKVNGHTVPLSAQGFFVWQIPIHAGMNPVAITIHPSGAQPPLAEEAFALHGAPPLSVLPALPLAIHSETLQPAADVWLSLHDTLTVSVSASVDADVSVTFPGLLETPVPLGPLILPGREYLDNREMVFAQLHQTKPRIPMLGYYQVTIPASTLFAVGKPAENLSIVLHLRHGGHSLSHTLPGRLTLLSHPRSAILTHDAVSRAAPVSGARLTPQLAGTAVSVDGLSDGWVRARLACDQALYLPLEDLQWRQQAAPAFLEFIATRPQGESKARVEMQFGQAQGVPPILIEPVPIAELNRLQVRLYGVRSRCDFIHYVPDDSGVGGVGIGSCHPETGSPLNDDSNPAVSAGSGLPMSDGLNPAAGGIADSSGTGPAFTEPVLGGPGASPIRFVDWRQAAENAVEATVDLHRPIAGYDYHWDDGRWVLTVKALPRNLADIRVLIDPGHGGTESGSVGLNGLPEKSLNLTISRMFAEALRVEGFRHVSLTRDDDVTLSLSDRARLARNADIFISLHHNALPDGRDPLAIEGACTFYYHLFSKPLAETLLAELTAPGGQFKVPNYGLFYDSLAMTRVHQAIAVLVELGFFTNPTEFERLINPAFQKEAAHRLAKALKAYCAGIVQN